MGLQVLEDDLRRATDEGSAAVTAPQLHRSRLTRAGAKLQTAALSSAPLPSSSVVNLTAHSHTSQHLSSRPQLQHNTPAVAHKSRMRYHSLWQTFKSTCVQWGLLVMTAVTKLQHTTGALINEAMLRILPLWQTLKSSCRQWGLLLPAIITRLPTWAVTSALLIFAAVSGQLYTWTDIMKFATDVPQWSRVLMIFAVNLVVRGWTFAKPMLRWFWHQLCQLYRHAQAKRQQKSSQVCICCSPCPGVVTCFLVEVTLLTLSHIGCCLSSVPCISERIDTSFIFISDCCTTISVFIICNLLCSNTFAAEPHGLYLCSQMQSLSPQPVLTAADCQCPLQLVDMLT